MKLVVFDMDGVLTEFFSSWVWVHKHFGTDNERSVKDYLEGRIDDEEFMRRDIALWKQKKEGVTEEHLREILEGVPIRAGARELVSWLRSMNIETAIVSGGIDLLAQRVGREAGIEHIFANGIESDSDGRLTGNGESVVKIRDKALTVRNLRHMLGVEREGCAAVGDSNIDASMFRECGLGIAFNPRPGSMGLVESADVVVETGDLRDIRPYLEAFFENEKKKHKDEKA